ncbi:MAG: hypothetical protein PHU66_10050 [Bacteroidaceae bacterium]|nr:hypothetical protein [Bacteroidaceae bacterium]
MNRPSGALLNKYGRKMLSKKEKLMKIKKVADKNPILNRELDF